MRASTTKVVSRLISATTFVVAALLVFCVVTPVMAQTVVDRYYSPYDVLAKGDRSNIDFTNSNRTHGLFAAGGYGQKTPPSGPFPPDGYFATFIIQGGNTGGGVQFSFVDGNGKWMAISETDCATSGVVNGIFGMAVALPPNATCQVTVALYDALPQWDYALVDIPTTGSSGVSVQILIGIKLNGNIQAQAWMPTMGTLSSNSIFWRKDAQSEVGIALLNPGTLPITVNLTFTDSFGRTVDEVPIPISPGSIYVAYVSQISSATLTHGEGTIVAQSTSPFILEGLMSLIRNGTFATLQANK